MVGRRHETIQTERFLEEIVDRPIQSVTGCQTDLYLYQMPPPPYMASQIGVDVATEIDEDELFDFDAEREKFVDELVEKTVATAVREVKQEEELADLRREKLKFIALRDAELSEIERLETEKLIAEAEKKRRTAMELIIEKLNVLLEDEADCAAAVEQRVSEVVSDVLSEAMEAIEEKNEANIKQSIELLLTDEVVSEFCQGVAAEEILRLIVADIVGERIKQHIEEPRDG